VSEIKKSLPGARDIQVDRIQNQYLWAVYVAQRKNVAEKRRHLNESSSIYDEVASNEKLLWHGTRSTKPSVIYNSSRGFDHAKSSTGMWGAGIYFSELASYSNNSYRYVTPKKKHQLLFVKVICGDAKHFTSSQNNLKRPPEKTAYKEENVRYFYDSVSADLKISACSFKTGKMFIVYDNCMAYPAFLVTYSL